MFSERKIWNDGAPFEDFMGRDGAPPVARRHLAFGGGKGGAGGTTYQQQTTTIPPEVRARYDAVNARAETAAQQPFQPYGGQFVAPLTATQQAGTAQIANAGQGYQPYQQAATTALTGAAEAALPYYGQAGQNIDAAQAAGAPYTGAATMAGLAGAQAVNPGQLEIGRYMDPYLQSVVAPTMQGLYQQQQQQQSQLMGSQAMRGAFGGDRGSIAAANLARQQGLAAQQTQAGLLSQGYGQALQAGQQQQGVGLQAGQANRAAMQQLSPQLLQIGQQAFQQPMAAAQAQQGLGQGLLGYGQNVAQGLSGLGQQGTQTGLASGQALLGAGTLEQQTQQQQNAALYNQYQQQQGYPFQIAQFLANIAYGGGPLYGSTTSGVTGSPTPFFSDERVKEDITEIGRTHDGQKIIKFKYKGSNQPQIGLSAQDVEKHHPEAVSETAEGIKAVDYDAATKHAERAYGGGLMPSSEGGAVHPSMAGLGFAAGGEVDMMKKMYPWGAAGGLGGGTPGASGGWTPGLSVKTQAPLGSGVQLKYPAARPTGLSQTIDDVKGGLSAVEDGKKLYKSGKEAFNWAKDGIGSIRDKLELPGLTKEAEDYAADPNVNPTVARGGRIGYEDGGEVDETPALPGGGDDTVLGQLAAKPLTVGKLDAPKLDMSSGDKGGGQKKDGTGKAVGSLAGAGIGAMFGPAGMGMGSTLGGMLGGMFARGGATDIEHAKGLISRVESGGRYDILGPEVRGQGRAHGKYQVMPNNIPSWTEEALGRRMTPAEFLASPEAQERVFEHHFGKSLKQYGNLADAASIWHSGVPLSEARRLGRRDVNMSTNDYVAKIMGGAPPAEAHMRPEMPEPPRKGLAPKISDADDLMGLVPEDENFEMPDPLNRFAAGGLVGRSGYEGGGTPVQVIDPDQVDPNDPAQAAILKAQIQRGSPPAPAPQSTPTPPPKGVAPVADPRTTGDRDLAGYPPAAGLAPPPKDPSTKDRDFLDRAGDWYDRNQNWVLPAVSGIGKMLASPSPYLGVAIGQGLAEAAPNAMAANFKQQGLDINMMDRLGKQVGVLASDIALRGGPGMSPELDKAQQAAMARYYRLSGVNYTPELTDPAKVRAQMAASPFARLREMDNPEQLYRSAQTPGLPGEQKQAFMDRAVQATKRLLELGFGVAADGSKVEFPDIHEAFRNSEYGRALVQAAAQTAGSGMPGGANFNANLQRNIEQAQLDVQRVLNANNGNMNHPDVRAAQQRVRDLQAQVQQSLPPSVPPSVPQRAYGGRTGYRDAGAVVDMTEAQPVDDIQLAQAMPPAPPAATARPMPHLPPTPSRAPEAKPIPTAPITPAGNLPQKYPETAGEFREYHRRTLNDIPAAESAQLLKRAEELESASRTSGTLPTTEGGVKPAPGVEAVKNTEDNIKWRQTTMPETAKRLETEDAKNKEIVKVLQTLETGKLGDVKSGLVGNLRAILGRSVPDTASANPTAYDELNKLAQERALLSPGSLPGNPTDARLGATQSAGIEGTKQPGANRHVVSSIIATNKWQRKYLDDYGTAVRDNPSLNPSEFARDWQSKPENAYGGIFDETYRTTPVRGDVPILRPENLTVGRHYLLEQDQARPKHLGGNNLGAYEFQGVNEKNGNLRWRRVN